MIVLTLPNGEPVWIERAAIVDFFKAPKGVCLGTTQIDLNNGKWICVIEAPATVAKDLEQ